MLKSNWTEGSAKQYGCRVIRQRLGRAPVRKSNAVHNFLSDDKRAALVARLEATARR
jgi:hypothetical protein